MTHAIVPSHSSTGHAGNDDSDRSDATLNLPEAESHGNVEADMTLAEANEVLWAIPSSPHLPHVHTPHLHDTPHHHPRKSEERPVEKPQSNSLDPSFVADSSNDHEKAATHGPGVAVPRKKGFIMLAANAVLLYIILLGTCLWFFGTNFRAGDRAYKLKVLVRDFDGSSFGQSMVAAVNSINGLNTMPTFVFSTDATEDEVYQRVWNGEFWGAITASEGATSNFDTTLAANTSESATLYNATSVYTTYYTSARYYTSTEGFILTALEQVLVLAEANCSEYAVSQYSLIGGALSSEMASVVATPASSTAVDIAPMGFQVRVYLNTYGIVIGVISQFFINLAINGIFLITHIYTTPISTVALLRLKYPIKFGWSLLTALINASYPLMFDEGWKFPAKNFFALWTAQWAYAYISFNTFGMALDMIPLPFMGMTVFPIVVTSISACIWPLEISNQFYRISYIFPSHAYWNTVITIYGRGIVNRLYIYCPVLMTWIIVTEIGWIATNWHLSKKSKDPNAYAH